jgi:heterodisulfide reductase subunit A
VSFHDEVFGREAQKAVDLVVLATPMVNHPDGMELAKMLRVPLGQEKFFFEAHVKLRPVDFATDGVFVCGLSHSPKASDEAVAQALAAVSRACTVLTKPFIEAEGKTAYVIKERCMACGLCEVNCPYSAIAVDATLGAAVVNHVLCKGCGVCTSSCRMNAADLSGFNNEEVLAQIEAM